MPILDLFTFKNPLLLWLNRRDLLNPPFLLRGVVMQLFLTRKKHWEESAKHPTDRETLTDKFLSAEKEHPGETELSPFRHSMTMVVAGAETT